MDYLSRHAVGLQDPADEYTEREKQAIMLVHGEIERQHRERMEKEGEKDRRRYGSEEQSE